MADIDGELDRQEQIWAGLYGRGRAADAIERARATMRSSPDAAVKQVLADLDADLAKDDDDDVDEAGTMRPI